MASLSGITSFLKTIEHGSFAGAATALGVSAVAVSKNVTVLERSLAVRLFNRSTRALTLTQEGRAFQERCAEPMRLLEEALTQSQTSTQAHSGLIRMTSLSPLGLGYVIPMLQKFYVQYPNIQVDLRLDDGVNDLVNGGFDLGIRVGVNAPDTAIARRISHLDWVVVGSVSYLSQFGVPKSPADLLNHRCVDLKINALSAQKRVAGAGSAVSSQAVWRSGSITAPAQQAIAACLTVNDFSALEQAAVRGLGLVQAPLPLVLPHFRSGLLRPVLPQLTLTGLQLYLYYRSRKNQPARVQLLIDYLLKGLRAQGDLTSDTQTLCAPYWA